MILNQFGKPITSSKKSYVFHSTKLWDKKIRELENPSLFNGILRAGQVRMIAEEVTGKSFSNPQDKIKIGHIPGLIENDS